MKAAPGDEVFFHHNRVPKSGKVIAAGKHGCHVKDTEGKPHKLRWEHVAGHKSRVPQNYKVHEEGEDGLIVGDDSGRKRLVRIPPEARAEQLVLQPQKEKTRPRNAPGA